MILDEGLYQYQKKDIIPPSNKTFFSVTDDEESYHNNLQKFGSSWHYANKEIIYKDNSLAYRTEELNYFKNKDFVLVLGCSHTYGTGLAEDEIWHYQIKKNLNLEVLNGGLIGSGPDLQMLNSMMFIKNSGLTPKAVIIQWPELNRFTFKGDTMPMPLVPYVFNTNTLSEKRKLIPNKIINTLTQMFKSDNKILDFYKNWLHDNNSINQSQVFIETTRLLWKFIPYLDFSFENDQILKDLNVATYSHLVNDVARDQIHFGPNSHEAVGIEICKKLSCSLMI